MTAQNDADVPHVLVIGGTGLLGTFTVREALARGARVSVFARSVRAIDGVDPNDVHAGDIAALSDDALRALCAGKTGVMYALGRDERDPPPAPAYDGFVADHVGVCGRVARAAKDAGVAKFVVCGSYFATLADTRPAWAMAQHVYVRSRLAQRAHLLGLVGDGFDVYVLELPYILGALPDNVPPWTLIFPMLAGPVATFFPTGGTSACTARQVAQASLGAMLGSAPSGAYAVRGVDWPWSVWASRFLALCGTPHKRVHALPRAAFVFFGSASALALRLRGRQAGLNIGAFADVQYGDAYVDGDRAMAAFGFGHDDYDAAYADVVRAWLARR